MFFPYGEKETAYLKAKDPKLADVIDRVGHIERAVDTDLFSAVVHHIVGQQISTKAQRTIWRRMRETFDEITPASMGDADVHALQTLGMTFRKAAYIKDFAEKVNSGAFDIDAVARMPDREAIEALTVLKGIGVWTAEMILLFCLQRPDILSYGDLAIQRGMRMVYRHRRMDRAKFERYRKRLSPCGSVASLYFWAVAGGAIPELTDPAPKKK
ncbi:MAG: DNA-3-methyladenine glycosylase 2 family protein [Lachnospiraceae bacterium]|nr:DNA-3-methyladenine glycosylase 2 family protein [Lachnospiraceae bacterium]